MRHTFREISAGIVLALSFSAPVPADLLEEAVAAYRSADYATALRVYRSLAEQGLAVAQPPHKMERSSGTVIGEGAPARWRLKEIANRGGLIESHAHPISSSPDDMAWQT